MSTESHDKERIAKFLSRAGVSSRRDAERMILDGRVRVNGVLLTTPACLVGAEDKVEVDGTLIAQKEQTRVWLYYKPVGLVTTHKDPEGRATVFEYLPKDMPRVISVGRLDLNSEGLLLLTNSGEFAHMAEHPKTGWPRTYRVRVYGDVDEQALSQLKDGITVDGVHYKSITAELTSQSNRNAWVLMTLHEGKNREIRKVMNHLGLQVNRLIRIAYGPFELGKMEPEDVREVSQGMLSKVLGEKV